MTEADGLLAAIQADVADDTVRLAAADWIEENCTTQRKICRPTSPIGVHKHWGRPGEVIHGVLHETDPVKPHHHCDERCFASEGQRRAEFIRVQVKIAQIEDMLRYDSPWKPFAECTSVSASWCPVCGDCCCHREPNAWISLDSPQCPLHNEMSRHTGSKVGFQECLEDLRERETELFDPMWLPHCNGGLREWYFSDFPANHIPDRPYSFVVRRGFVSRLIVGCDEFFPVAWEWGKDPLEHIHLSDFECLRLEGRCRVNVDNAKQRILRRDGPGRGGAHYLPPPFKELLKGGDRTGFAYGDRVYPSIHAMRKDLCQACVAYTRLPRNT